MINISSFLEKNPSFNFYLQDYLKVYPYSETLQQQLTNFRQSTNYQLGDWEYIRSRMIKIAPHIPYYSKIDWNAKNYWLSLKLIDKEELSIHYNQFINTQYAREQLWVRPTNGSTGPSINILYAPEFGRDIQFNELYKVMHLLKIPLENNTSTVHCLRLHNRTTLEDIVSINATTPHKLHARMILDKKNPASFKKLFTFLSCYAPDAFSTKPSILRAILAFMAQHTTINRPSIPMIISAGAYLPEQLRQTVEYQLNTKVYNNYGMSEFGNIAVECQERKGMHVYQSHLILEILTPTGLQKEGIGELVISSVDNPAMPLLRFKTGDIVELTQQPCTCGKEGWRIAKIYGRRLILVRATDGATYPIEEFENIPKLWPVSDFQIIQASLDTITIHIQPHPSTNPEPLITAIQQHFTQYLGHHLQVEVTLQTFARKLLPCEQYLSRIKNQW